MQTTKHKQQTYTTRNCRQTTTSKIPQTKNYKQSTISNKLWTKHYKSTTINKNK